MQKILLLSLTNRFLDRGANLPPSVQTGCKNSPVYIGLILNVLKKALNNIRGHITAKKCLKRPKVVTFFLSRTLVYSRPMQVGTVPLATLLIASLVLISVLSQINLMAE